MLNTYSVLRLEEKHQVMEMAVFQEKSFYSESSRRVCRHYHQWSRNINMLSFGNKFHIQHYHLEYVPSESAYLSISPEVLQLSKNHSGYLKIPCWCHIIFHLVAASYCKRLPGFTSFLPSDDGSLRNKLLSKAVILLCNMWVSLVTA